VEAWLASPYVLPAMEQSELRPVLRSWTADNVQALLGDPPDTDAPLFPPAIDRLAEIAVPTLLLIGARDVPDIHRILKHLAKHVPHSKTVEFPKVGHLLNLEERDRFNRVVLDFLQGV